jgi:hypothetical protein
MKIRSGEYYQYLVDSITEEAMRKVIQLNEYAIHKAEFRATVDGLWYRIMEHWCYLKYAQLYNPERQETNHWSRELHNWLCVLQNAKLKRGGRKSVVMVKVLIEEHDLDDANEVLELMENDFEREGFNDHNHRLSVCQTFSEKVYDIIRLVDNKSLNVNDYIHKEFFG